MLPSWQHSLAPLDPSSPPWWYAYGPPLSLQVSSGAAVQGGGGGRGCQRVPLRVLFPINVAPPGHNQLRTARIVDECNHWSHWLGYFDHDRHGKFSMWEDKGQASRGRFESSPRRGKNRVNGVQSIVDHGCPWSAWQPFLSPGDLFFFSVFCLVRCCLMRQCFLRPT